jgi:hypothetical protein
LIKRFLNLLINRFTRVEKLSMTIGANVVSNFALGWYLDLVFVGIAATQYSILIVGISQPERERIRTLRDVIFKILKR